MLALTPEHLMLYSSDESLELKRIPVKAITDVKYSKLRQGLEISIQINGKQHQEMIIRQLQADMHGMMARQDLYRDQLHRAAKDDQDTLNLDINMLAADIDLIKQKIKKQRDKKTQNKTEKMVLKLPVNFGDATWDVSQEYRVWEYAIKRRTQTTPHIRIESEPPNAVVLLEDYPLGSTPLTIPAPLHDTSVANKKYVFTLVDEKHRYTSASVPVPLVHEQIMVELEGGDPNCNVSDLRQLCPDRTIDLLRYDILESIQGKINTLVFLDTGMLVVTLDRQTFLYQIPYKNIIDTKHIKKRFGGDNYVEITYDDNVFQDLVVRFVASAVGPEADHHHLMVVNSINNRRQIIWERYGRLKERAQAPENIATQNNMGAQQKAVQTFRGIRWQPGPDMPPRRGRPQKDWITERDIKNNFPKTDPYEFEQMVGVLFKTFGYKVQVTKAGADGGIDVFAWNKHKHLAIQVKKWQQNVGDPDVNKTLGSMLTKGCNRAVVVTTSGFTKQALGNPKRGKQLELWDGDKLRTEFRKNRFSDKHGG